MPELPEVETVRLSLIKLIQNKTIENIEILDKRMGANSPLDLSLLKNQTIINIYRLGKYLFFLFNDYVLISHLRMEGKYYFYYENETISSHARVIFYFSDKTKLVYDDVRRFGTMELYNKNDVKNSPTVLNLGKEPWAHTFDSFSKLVSSSSSLIKNILLDQHIISGIGNIYADEILFKSKISPYRKGNSLSKEEIDSLLISSRIILEEAIKEGGSTIKSYHPSRDIDGRFQQKLSVYNKAGENCPSCNTKILKSFIGGRGSSYCPKCQNVSKIIGIYGKIASGKSTFLSYFKEDNFPIFSSDEEVNKIYKEDKNFLGYCIYHFSQACLDEHNNISKNYIKQVVISDPSKKKLLEDYLHPEVKKRAEAFINKNRHSSLVILEVPLLFESKMDKMCDYIIGIDADIDSQIRNLKARKSSSVSMDLLLNSSSKFDANIKHVDFLVKNDSTLLEYKNQYIKIRDTLLKI